MMSGWTIFKHLEVSEIESRYKSCESGREKTHWQIIFLAMQSLSSKDIAKIVRYGQRWVEKLIQRYNEEGPNGLLDKRKHNKSDKLLSPELMNELEKALESPPPDGGLWTSPKVALWMSDKLGRPVISQTAWYYLGYLKQRLKVPRPHNPLSDPSKVSEFKKKLPRFDARCSNGIR
jgi:transposase